MKYNSMMNWSANYFQCYLLSFWRNSFVSLNAETEFNKEKEQTIFLPKVMMIKTVGNSFFFNKKKLQSIFCLLILKT